MSEPNPSKVRDLTKSVHADDDQGHAKDPVYARTRKLVIRFGTIFFALCAVALFAPILIGVGQGVARDKMWDPYTGNPIEAGTPRVQCMDDAQRLMVDAGRHKKLVPGWAEPHRNWISACRKDHPELYELLRRTREQLLRKQMAQQSAP